MNIALEQTEEYVNGQLRNKYGDTFIRGNNGKYTADKIENMTRLSRIFTLAISKRYREGKLTFFFEFTLFYRLYPLYKII